MSIAAGYAAFIDGLAEAFAVLDAREADSLDEPAKNDAYFSPAFGSEGNLSPNPPEAPGSFFGSLRALSSGRAVLAGIARRLDLGLLPLPDHLRLDLQASRTSDGNQSLRVAIVRPGSFCERVSREGQVQHQELEIGARPYRFEVRVAGANPVDLSVASVEGAAHASD
jgi:hypothetical protein